MQSFKAYASIQNHYRQKYIKAVKDLPDFPDMNWIVQEKIHGCNFTICFFEKGIRYGRRNGFLTALIPYQLKKEQIENYQSFFNQKFYNCHEKFKKLHHQFQKVFQNCKSQFQGLQAVNVYGELFGGIFNKVGKSAVQKEVEYSPELQYLAFDVFISTEDKHFWAPPQDVQKLLCGVIRMVPVLKRGTFDQCFSFQSKFNSTIPQLLGYKKQGDNISQGVIIRPCQHMKVFDDRVIIKKKNQEFKEVVSKPKQQKDKEKKQLKLTPQEIQDFQAISQYCTGIRVASVLSKKDTKDLNQISKMMIEDMWSDFGKDGKQAKCKELKNVNAQLKKVSIGVIKEHLKK